MAFYTYNYKSSVSYKKRRQFAALAFGLMVFLAFFAAFLSVMLTAGPVILDTKINFAGLNEVFCIGYGCRDL